MSIPKRKQSMPDLTQFDTPQEEKRPSLRDSAHWKYMYRKLLPERNCFKTEEQYMKHIDRLAGTKSSNKNLIASWNSFKPDNYDSEFKEKVKEFGSEERYFAWLEAEKKRVQAENKKREAELQKKEKESK